MSTEGWIGVDLDGTLAQDSRKGPAYIGAPIPAMVERVKQWLKDGKKVKIFTARAYPGGRIGEKKLEEVIIAIRVWCREHIGEVLPITYAKDYGMIELWDDRAVQIIPNTGVRADGRK